MSYRIARNGKVIGKISEEKLQLAIDKNKILHSDHIYSESLGEWCLLPEVSEEIGIKLTKNNIPEPPKVNDSPKNSNRKKLSANTIPEETDPKILKKLREYDKLDSTLCLICGYNGLMGVEETLVPWYVTWWVLIPIFLTGIGIIPALLLGFFRASVTENIVRCPNCDNHLK